MGVQRQVIGSDHRFERFGDRRAALGAELLALPPAEQLPRADHIERFHQGNPTRSMAACQGATRSLTTRNVCRPWFRRSACGLSWCGLHSWPWPLDVSTGKRSASW